jgi:periplasmic protein TonB
MFNELVESTANRKAGRRGWTIAVSMMLQTISLLVLLLLPLLYTQALPTVFSYLKGTLIAPVPLESSPTPAKAPPASLIRRVRLFENGVVHEPTAIPRSAAIFKEAELPPEAPADSNHAGPGGMDLFSFLRDSRIEALPPAPAPIQRIRQTHIEPAMILAQPQPVYPSIARIARIQGDVVLHAIIDREGRIVELQVVSGHPLLVQAALAAVRTWRYQPTLLSGEPVEVETTITVTFVLNM